MIDSKIYSLFGLARRAGKTVLGKALFESLRRRRVHLILLAADASDNFKKVMARAQGSQVVVIEYLDQKELGLALDQGPINAVGFTDPNLAARIATEIKSQKGD